MKRREREHQQSHDDEVVPMVAAGLSKQEWLIWLEALITLALERENNRRLLDMIHKELV